MPPACFSFRRVILTVLFAWLVSPLASANDASREVTASGQGSSRDAAIIEGLLAGARQVPALRNVNDSVLRPVFETWVRDESRVPVDRTGYKRQVAPAIDSAAGIIRDYEVLGVTRKATGEWHADLLIRLAGYDVRAENARQRVPVLVMPFSLHSEEEAETGGMEAQTAALRERAEIDMLHDRLSAALAEGLVDIRVPDVEMQADPRLALSYDNPGAVPWASLAEKAGNSFFVAVDVEDYVLEFRPENVRKKEPAYWRARFVLAWRIIAAPDAVVMASGRLRLDLADPQLHVATRVANAGTDPRHAVPLILDVAAFRLARQLEERLVPVQVLSTNGNVVTLDVGAVTLAAGDALAVLGAGTVEREEGAALPLYLDGPRVAVLETLTADRKRATARIVRGNAATLLPGAPVRRLAELPVPRMP